MQAWRRAFSAMGVYIGGVEAGCASPNLTAGWVRAVTGLGWALMPTYVGRQASCSSFSVRIRPARAVAQGHAAALTPPSGRRPGDGPGSSHDTVYYHGAPEPSWPGLLAAWGTATRPAVRGDMTRTRREA